MLAIGAGVAGIGALGAAALGTAALSTAAVGAGVVGVAALAGGGGEYGGGGEFVQDGVVGHHHGGHHGEHHGDDDGHHNSGEAEPLCDPDFSHFADNSHLEKGEFNHHLITQILSGNMRVGIGTKLKSNRLEVGYIKNMEFPELILSIYHFRDGYVNLYRKLFP